MTRFTMLLPVVLFLAACGSGQPAADGKSSAPAASGSSVSVSASAGGATQGSTVARADSSAGGERAFEEKTERYSFKYSYPAQAGAIPALRTILDARLERERKQLDADTLADKKEMESSGFPYRPYELDTEWKVVTDLPRWLSLSAQHYAYTGGAHGNHGFDTLLWDREANVSRAPLSLFISVRALNTALGKEFCAELNRARAKKRGAPVKPDATDPFSECIAIDEGTVILGSTNGSTFDRIGFLIPPYAAGPYVEGDYEVTLPVTRGVIAAVKPEYRPSFSVAR